MSEPLTQLRLDEIETKGNATRQLVAAIEEMIAARISATVHMNHKYDTLDNARKKLYDQLTAVF